MQFALHMFVVSILKVGIDRSIRANRSIGLLQNLHIDLQV